MACTISFTAGFSCIYSSEKYNSLSLAVNTLENSLLCSHMGLIGHYVDFAPGSWQGIVGSMSGLTDSDTRAFICRVPPGNVLEEPNNRPKKMVCMNEKLSLFSLTTNIWGF